MMQGNYDISLYDQALNSSVNAKSCSYSLDGQLKVCDERRLLLAVRDGTWVAVSRAFRRT